MSKRKPRFRWLIRSVAALIIAAMMMSVPPSYSYTGSVLPGPSALLSAASAPPAWALPASSPSAVAADDVNSIYTLRKQWFELVSEATGLPWATLAAIDQYDRTMNVVKRRKLGRAGSGTDAKATSQPPLFAIYYSAAEWTGPLNPDQEDTHPLTINLFGGIGADGSGDGVADRQDDLDRLSVLVSYLLKYGTSEAQLNQALLARYDHPRSVERIAQFAKIYMVYNRLDLHRHAFPVALSSSYSYRSTWGASRSWGGRRNHEGTDIFAGYGVPARSACYGIIEEMGWNPYGGWRIGIRDLDNVYHYYAHLSGFNKKLRQGDIVEPGQVVGWVGSSGYGKPGTQGKFPPHLHYGLYRDNGKVDWSYDPYPSLKRWERDERRRAKR